MKHDTTRAVECLADVFLNLLRTQFPSLCVFEREAIDIGHSCICSAMEKALEALDCDLMLSKPSGVRIHEIRKRSLATEVGDISFKRHICRDKHGHATTPLDEMLNLCRSARISPGATEFLVEAGAEVFYARAARLLARHGSSVSSGSVMHALRDVGKLLEQDDTARAHELYVEGVLPDADQSAEEVFVEADGTYIALQKGGKAEIKALVAYAGKSATTRLRRRFPVRFGCVGNPHTFWTQGMAHTAKRFNFANIDRAHFGFDGESWCKQGSNYLPSSIKVDAKLDPFHLNRALASLFDNDAPEKRQVMSCIFEGDVKGAKELLALYAKLEKISAVRAQEVARYLSNNEDYIHKAAPSLGTMEAEIEHLCASRMKARPCAWSKRGVSDMARIRSRIYSGESLIYRDRENSLRPTRKQAQEKQIEKTLTAHYTHPVKYEGKGFEYPVRASISHMRADIRYKAGYYEDHWVEGASSQ